MISVICPIYNEENTIIDLLNYFANSLPFEKELFIIDGNSSDNSKLRFAEWSEINSCNNIYWLDNPNKYVSYALNLAIPKCKGDIIIRIDAHTLYSDNYFDKIIETFNTVDTDIVGGPMRIAVGTCFQNAIGYVTSTLLGVGDSSFHFIEKKGYVDSVYLGAWRAILFSELGYFDEELIRNQDDEFHYRAKSKGKKIFLNPEIKAYYFPRKNIVDLFKQYYQYGFFKPRVLLKIRSSVKIRHIIPSFLIIYLLLLCILFAVNKLFIFSLIPLFVYGILLLFYSIRKKVSFIEIFYRVISYLTIHIGYGLGFIFGFSRIIFSRIVI